MYGRDNPASQLLHFWSLVDLYPSLSTQLTVSLTSDVGWNKSFIFLLNISLHCSESSAPGQLWANVGPTSNRAFLYPNIKYNVPGPLISLRCFLVLQLYLGAQRFHDQLCLYDQVFNQQTSYKWLLSSKQIPHNTFLVTPEFWYILSHQLGVF